MMEVARPLLGAEIHAQVSPSGHRVSSSSRSSEVSGGLLHVPRIGLRWLGVGAGLYVERVEGPGFVDEEERVVPSGHDRWDVVAVVLVVWVVDYAYGAVSERLS